MLTSAGAVGSVCEETLGLPCARHRWFQLAPIHPSQGTAEVGAGVNTSGEMYLRRERKKKKTTPKNWNCESEE